MWCAAEELARSAAVQTRVLEEITDGQPVVEVAAFVQPLLRDLQLRIEGVREDRRRAPELLGEEDFGRYVSDVLMLDYETWLAATPGGRSAPASVLGPTFDRIFRRPRSLRRPAENMRLRLVS